MRPSIRHLGVLVACLSAASPSPRRGGARRSREAAKGAGKRAPGPEGGGRLPGDGDRPARARCRPAPALADWAAATDVTPEHVAQRTGADKALAALIGSTSIIDKTKALLKNEKQLDDLTVRQLRKLLLAAAESARDDPRGRRQARRAGGQAVGHPRRLHLLPAAEGRPAAPSRSPPTTSTTS